jgi:hypothetical protein
VTRKGTQVRFRVFYTNDHDMTLEADSWADAIAQGLANEGLMGDKNVKLWGVDRDDLLANPKED